MGLNYSISFIKIYFWQSISFLINILSLVIVIPYISKDINIYGVYSLCISLTVFLSYTDIGFVSSGQKYAAEFYSRNKKMDEMETIGFVSFILLIFLGVFSLIFFILSNFPLLIFNSLKADEIKIASNLFLVLGLFTPVTLLQRQLQIIYGIRLQEYILHRITILGNIIKLISVFWFFRNDQKEIVQYFIFINLVNLFMSLISMLIAKKKFDYNLLYLIRCIKFSKAVFSRTKSLALSSFFITLAGIFVYELDSIAISYMLGTDQLAFYSIGLTLLSFFRSVLSIIYAPISIRIYQLFCDDNLKNLKKLFKDSILNTLPFVVIPIFVIFLFMKPLIYTWIGSMYDESVITARLLISINILAFLAYPVNSLMMAQERIRELNILSIFTAVLYWLGIFLTFNYWGINSFSFFKLFSFLITGIYLGFVAYDFISFNIYSVLKYYIIPLASSLFFAFISYRLLAVNLIYEKSTMNFVYVLMCISIVTLSTLIVFFLVCKKYTVKIKKIASYIKY